MLQIGEKEGFSLDSEKVVKDGFFVKLRDEEKWFYLGDEATLDTLNISKQDDRYNILIDKKIGEELQFPHDKYAAIGKRTVEYILPLQGYIFWKARHCFEKMAKSGSPIVQIIAVPEKDGKA